MFLDIDYKRRIQGAKIHLARPNKVIISHIYEAYNKNLSRKIGDINELTFSIPYKVSDETGDYYDVHDNEHIDMIREKMLVRVTMEGYEEWFTVGDIDEEGSDTDTFTVTAYSLGYELKGKRISELEMESANMKEVLDVVLEDTLWKVKEIDNVFTEMYRKFESGTDSNALNCLIELAKTFNAIIVWDTINREISIKEQDSIGAYRGLNINYGRLMTSIRRSRTPEELVTRLYVRGNEDLSIHRVNPTGQGYLEDFSYFMYPFQRNDDGFAYSSSYFMSDDLCHALLDHEILINQHAPIIRNLTEEIQAKRVDIALAESSMQVLELELDGILELLDIAKSAEDNSAITRLNGDKTSKEAEISIAQASLDNLEFEYSLLEDELDDIHEIISNQSNFTKELRDELKYFIIESEWQDDNYIDDEELYRDALEKFKEIRSPKITIEATIANILNSLEEQYYWDKLVLGDFVKVSYPQMKIKYEARIIEMNFDLDNDEVELVIANSESNTNAKDRLTELIYSSQTATNMVQNNKYKWDRIVNVSDEVHDLINSEWNANKNKIVAGVRNSIQIGNRGIIIENPDFPNELLIIQSGVLAISKDKGETWKTAVNADGVVAERLVGQLVAGQNLIITNSAGTFTMDENGFIVDSSYFKVTSSSGDRNLVDDWNKSGEFIEDLISDNMITPYEMDRLMAEWRTLNSRYNYLSNILDLYYDGGGEKEYKEIRDFHLYYTQLFDYLFTENQSDGYPLLSNSRPSQTSVRIDATKFTERFNNYNDSVPLVEELIELRSKQLQDDALELAKSAKDLAEEVLLGTSYRVDITSTKGLIFKNNIIDTRIYATVFKGDEDITSQIPKSNFKWRKVNADGTDDVAWNAVHNGVGSYVDVTSEDVHQKATFSCSIDVDID